MILTEHLTGANFDLQFRTNASLTLEMSIVVRLDQTLQRAFVFSCYLGP